MTTTTLKSSSILVRCSDCGTPVFEVRDGDLVIRARHHEREHVTRIPLTALQGLTVSITV